MDTIKVFLSPSFPYEYYIEPVTGMKFEGGRGINVYSIGTHGLDLAGIQSALRKNILLPFDKETRDYVNGTNFAAQSVPAVEKQAEEEPKAEVKEIVAEEVKAEEKEEKKPVKKKEKKDK